MSQFLVLVNILLACFNLLPIPPLDGSRIVDAIIPSALRPLWGRFSALGPLLLVAVILLPGLLGVSILSWPIRWAGELLAWVTGR